MVMVWLDCMGDHVYVEHLYIIMSLGWLCVDHMMMVSLILFHVNPLNAFTICTASPKLLLEPLPSCHPTHLWYTESRRNCYFGQYSAWPSCTDQNQRPHNRSCLPPHHASHFEAENVQRLYLDIIWQNLMISQIMFSFGTCGEYPDIHRRPTTP